jgi:UDP-glucose 4-epimerase
MKEYIVVTGGAGFIGSNLIEYLILKTNDKIISLDNYSSGSKKNHIINKRIIYINADTNEINSKLQKYKKKIKVVFHFGEFARIHQSFIESLSPYAFSKSKNLNLLEQLKKWFGLSYEALYFYNVYGPRHIKTGPMATVIGIFENQYKKNIALSIVRPGTQSRKFTHVQDTIGGCFYAWKQNKNRHYSLSNTRSYQIINVAKMFSKKIKLIPPKLGERKKSSIVKKIGSNKIYLIKCSRSLKDYINHFKKNF